MNRTTTQWQTNSGLKKDNESNNYENDWSGTAHRNSIGNSDKVPTGTYYYIVKLRDSGLKPFTGPIYVGTK